MLSDSARATLIRIARTALHHAVEGRPFTPEDPGEPELAVAAGCFVTLKTGGRLRGCLGCFVSSEPVYRGVAAFAARSATEDPRFLNDRLRPEELPQVHLDISVLSPLVRCDDPEAIELGTHGIYIRQGGRSGCFLPQVATETGWTVEQFWSQCCAGKARLPADAWRRGEAELFTFTAEVIDDPAPGRN